MTEYYEFTTKDSGEREDYDSGMRRDTASGKPRYDLIDRSMLKRDAELMARGAEKYGERNWELANSEEEAARFQASAFRHFMQWMNGERDEDHAAATRFNIAAYEYVRAKLEEPKPLVGEVYVSGPPSGAGELEFRLRNMKRGGTLTGFDPVLPPYIEEYRQMEERARERGGK